MPEIVIYYEPRPTQRLWWTGKQFSNDAQDAKVYRAEQFPIIQRLLKAQGYGNRRIASCSIEEIP